MADWIVLAFLAADNDLEGALLGDLKEMERVGSRPGSVEVLAQIDRGRGHGALDEAWTGTRRYHVLRGSDPQRLGSKLLAELGQTDTGDPRVLEDFVAFGARAFPARAHLLLLSNHGSGFYVPPEMLLQATETVPRAATVRRRGAQVTRSYFHTTCTRLRATEPERGILYDDGAGDCLDNRELKAVLAHARQTLGRKVAIVGMDACLMTMLEVAYQIRNDAEILVGSEEVEPGAGWPHDLILRDLTAKPAMTPCELATTIVRRYVESYAGTGQALTQSAIDLAQLEDLVHATDALARALLGALPSRSLELAVYHAWRRSLRFFDNLYVDLHHFAANLGRVTSRGDVKRACVEIQAAIEAPDGPIIAAAHGGARMAAAAGLSIYFPPFREPSVFYRELDFARATRWADFLDAYLGKRSADSSG